MDVDEGRNQDVVCLLETIKPIILVYSTVASKRNRTGGYMRASDAFPVEETLTQVTLSL